ncbi:MAG: FlgD immunoglobulin-like domain containing protein [Candidatus Zhuqueibacterota bacterium]
MQWIKGSICCLAAFIFTNLAIASTPDWDVNPADFEMSANMTAVLYLDEKIVTGTGNYVGVFDNGSCRGVASSMNIMNTWMYFITIYSNVNNRPMSLKAYISAQDTVLDIAETITFVANSTYGSPTTPYELNAYMAYDFPPIVCNIQDQRIEVGQSFTPIVLENYLQQSDDDTIEWTYSGNKSLRVLIDENNTAIITPPSPGWVGSDSIIFTATERTASELSDSDTALFTISPTDQPPQFTKIPDQTIGLGGKFNDIPLKDYLVEENGDSIVWDYSFLTKSGTTDPPTWSVNPNDYEMSMTMTAEIIVRGETASAGNYVLGAFALAPNKTLECRGTASPTKVLGSYIYFLTVYSDMNNEKIEFRFYNAPVKEILPVKEHYFFSSNESYGSPTEPIALNAGNLHVTMKTGGIVHLEVVDSTWSGAETIEFIASDFGTIHHFSDSTSAVFTILPDHNPIVSGIPDQTVDYKGVFLSFDLDDYLVEIDQEQVQWTYSGITDLQVTIDNDHKVTVSPKSPEWVGSEVIIFTVTDVSANELTSSDSAKFTIKPLDHPPVLSDIPDQIIGIGSKFQAIDLTSYVTEVDGDTLVWSYEFAVPEQTDEPPNWSVVPAMYESSMNITAIVTCQGKTAGQGDFVLGAFAADLADPTLFQECRGTATPMESMGSWFYFLTIYSNKSGEEIRLKFYSDTMQKIFPIQQSYFFVANEFYGNPADPCSLNASYLTIDINEANQAMISIVDESWLGTEKVWFIATDKGTVHQYADSSLVTFSVIHDHVPIVQGIPDQRIELGDSFSTFDLDDYLTEEDDNGILWTRNESVNFDVAIDTGNVVTVTAKKSDWTGSEVIIFTGTDNTMNHFADSDSAKFTVLPVDHKPVLSEIPEQSAYLGCNFLDLTMEYFLEEVDNDSLLIRCEFPVAPDCVTTPVWSVQPKEFELSMNVIAQVICLGDTMQSGSHVLGAFCDNQCRGVASPTSMFGGWIYFITLYANEEVDSLSFRFFNASTGEIFPVKEKVQFASNSVLGKADDPFVLHSGFLEISISDRIASIDVIDWEWVGEEEVRFIVKDIGTLHEFADSQLVTFTVLDSSGSHFTQYIPLNPKKVNMISFNVMPESAAIDTMLDDVSSLLLAQDDEGNFYIPPYKVNTIHTVDFSNGYQVYYTSNKKDTIVNRGFDLLPTTVLQHFDDSRLFMIGYPYQQLYEIKDVFSAIMNAVVVVQDDAGKFWIPDYNVNTINLMRPGKGYQIFVDETLNFTYPDLSDFSSKKVASCTQSGIDQEKAVKHFTYNETGQPYCILITGSEFAFSEGDELAAFAEDRCVGAAIFTGQFPVILPAWQEIIGRDFALPGFTPGQPIQLKLWRPSDSRMSNIAARFEKKGMEFYGAAAFSAVHLLEADQVASLPDKYALFQNFPNPFNPETTIRYQLPAMCPVEIVIYTVLGQKVRTLVDEKKPAGHYEISWDGKDASGQEVASGAYMMSMKAGNFSSTQKLLLVK